jgi:hypothetical protein
MKLETTHTIERKKNATPSTDTKRRMTAGRGRMRKAA